MINQNEPKKHHYVPKAFLKAWANDKNQVDWTRFANQINTQINISNIFYEKNLYRLSEQIEEDFVTLFIDNLFFKYLSKFRDQYWAELSDEDKKGLVKYLISLNARNPKSLKSMSSIIKETRGILIELLGEKIKIDEKIKENLDLGLTNGNLLLMTFMIKDLELKESDINNMKKDENRATASLLIELTKLAEIFGFNSLGFPSMILEEADNIIVEEFITSQSNLITSNYPVLIEGIGNNGLNKENFYILSNISPNKAVIFSFNEGNILKEYKNCITEDQKIVFFNKKLTENKSCEQIVKKIT